MAFTAAPILDWEWVFAHLDDIRGFLVQHVVLTALALFFGFLIAFPLSLAAVRWPRLYYPLVNISAVLYTVPSLALFILLIPFTGLSYRSSLIGLTMYTLLILIRNTVEGFRVVPEDVRDAARAMGYTQLQRLMRVELPLAIPVIVAGLRIAAVTTIGLVAVTAFIGQGGLGQLMLIGFLRDIPTMVVVGIVLSVVLAVLADLLLVVVERVLTPWARARRAHAVPF